MFKKVSNKALAVVAFTSVVSANPFAAEGAVARDYTQLTSGIDFSQIGTGVLAVAALLAAVYAGIKGAKIVLAFLR